MALLASIVVLSASDAFAIHDVEASKNDVWVISQSNRFLGALDLYIASDRVKVVHRRDRWQILCAPPTWDVVISNPRTKTRAVSTMAEWRKYGLTTMFTLDPMPMEWPIVPEFDFEYKGIKARQYAFPFMYKNGTVAPLRKGRAAECITTKSVKTAPQVIEFIVALYNSSPKAPGVPLEISKFGTPQSFGLGLKYNKIEELYTILKTVSIKTVPRAQVDYSVPSTYVTRPRNEVVLGGQGKDIGGIMDLLGGD